MKNPLTGNKTTICPVCGYANDWHPVHDWRGDIRDFRGYDKPKQCHSCMRQLDRKKMDDPAGKGDPV